MGRKVSSPEKNQLIINENGNEDWGNLVLRISKGDYVLVVGSEIVLSKEMYPNCNGDSHKLLLQEAIDGLIAENRLGIGYTCNSFSELNDDVGAIHQKVPKIIEDRFAFTVEDASNDLITLLKTKCFRVVLTTTVDPTIEMIMKDIWGEIRVMNIYESAGYGSDFDPKEHNISEYYDTKPTLFYVFGKMGNGRKYVLTDNDSIEVIKEWLNPDKLKKFKRYVNNKRILAVGCKFDNWLFRFFWYAIRQQIEDLKGEVAMTMDTTSGSSDESLYQYLVRNKINTYDNAHDFIERLNHSLADVNSRFVNINMRRRQGGIFISYANEDLPIVSQIFERLDEEGFAVWLDNEKLIVDNGEPNYNQRIERAIGECRVFVPIFSAQTKKDFEDRRERYYKTEEWRLATYTLKKPHIKPIQLNGYNCREKYHQEICSEYENIATAAVFDLYSQPFQKYIDGLKELLNEQVL